MHKARSVLTGLFLSIALTGQAGAAVTYYSPALQWVFPSPDLYASVVPVTGSYPDIGQTVQMVQTGPAIGPVSSNLSTFTLSGAYTTAMRVDFYQLMSFASVSYVPNDNDKGIFQAYDANGFLLGEEVSRNSSPFTLSFTASDTLISYVLATYSDSGGIGEVGYEVGHAVTPIPEPNIYALLLAGLCVMAWQVKRKKT